MSLEAKIKELEKKFDRKEVEWSEHSRIRKIRDRRWKENRNINIITTSRDSTTGTGKTTLAICICKLFDRYGWSYKKATLSKYEYEEIYDNCKEGEMILYDEPELDMHNWDWRQSQDLIKTWATKRYKKVSSILSLPSMSLLTPQVKELADYRLHIVPASQSMIKWSKQCECGGGFRRAHKKIAECRMCGKTVKGHWDREEVFVHSVKKGNGDRYAMLLKSKVHDRDPSKKWEELKARIRWPDLDDDLDYQIIHQMKIERLEGGDYQKYIKKEKHLEEMEKQRKEIERKMKYRFIKKLAYDDEIEITQSKIAEITGFKQGYVSTLLNSKLKRG